MKVFELCKRTVACVRRDETLLEAARKMRESHVGDLVVVEDRDNRRVPVAMLTDRDIVVGVLAKDVAHLDKLDVGDVVGEDLVTASEEEDVGDVLRRMRSFAVRRVPVVDDAGALTGIISLDDVLAGLAEHFPQMLRCDVAVEEPHRHHQHGNHFRVRINVSLPGAPAVVDRSSSLDDKSEDIHAAIEAAFDDVERMIRDRYDRRRTKRLHDVGPRHRV